MTEDRLAQVLDMAKSLTEEIAHLRDTETSWSTADVERLKAAHRSDRDRLNVEASHLRGVIEYKNTVINDLRAERDRLRRVQVDQEDAEMKNFREDLQARLIVARELDHRNGAHKTPRRNCALCQAENVETSEVKYVVQKRQNNETWVTLTRWATLDEANDAVVRAQRGYPNAVLRLRREVTTTEAL